MLNARAWRLGASLVGAALLAGAAPAPVTLKASAGSRIFELTIGAPDTRLRGNLPGPAGGPSVQGGPGAGRGPMAGGPGPGRGPLGRGGPGPGRGPLGRGGPGPGKGPMGGGPGPMDDGPPEDVPDDFMAGPEGMLDPLDPTHSATLRIKDKAGKIHAEYASARLVAVRRDLNGVAIALLRPQGKAGYASNLQLPGKGKYRLFLRAIGPGGKPLLAGLDFTY